jgi:hypothetical protein
MNFEKLEDNKEELETEEGTENENNDDWMENIDPNEGQEFGLYEASVGKLSKKQFEKKTETNATKIRVGRDELDKRYSDQTLDEVNEDVVDSIQIEKPFPISHKKKMFPYIKEKILFLDPQEKNLPTQNGQ